MDVLIGATGFVGGNLLRQTHFDRQFHSRNIESLAGWSCRRIVCAGAPGAKWLANRDPAADWASIRRLTQTLEQVTADEFILISTVDVFGQPVDVDEHTTVDEAAATPYGRHRHRLEQFARQRFNATVVRLPGLFGQGLKKNIIFDLLHDHQVQRIPADSVFQFYYLDRLWRDIEVAHNAGLDLVHLATEPVGVRDVARVIVDGEFDSSADTPPARYDFRTCHADLYGSVGGYIRNKDEVLSDLSHFVATFREKARCA